MVSKKPSVLIVDDEQVICDLLCKGLSERDYQCAAALDGNEALTKLAAQDFDVVLLDIRLPGMSGIEVLRKLWLNHSNTVIIMITAVNDVDTAVEAMRLGASDYIVKPFTPDEINDRILAVLESRQAADKPSTEMDAITHGIEVKLDPFSSYSEMVTQRTIEIARQLDIAEEEIQRWAAARARLDSARNGVIKSSWVKV